MTSGRKVAVFGAYEPFFRILTAYDAENLRNQDRSVLIRNIWRAIMISVLSLAFIGAMVCDVTYCLGYNFDVTKIASAFGVFINSIQVAITFISIRKKNDLLHKVIAGISKITNERRFFWDEMSIFVELFVLFYVLHFYRM